MGSGFWSFRVWSIRVWSLGLVLLLLGGCDRSATTSTRYEAEVQRVASGHSLEVTIPQVDPARIQRVRLIGIDAPNPAQEPWGPAAQKFLQDQLEQPEGSKARIQLEVDLQQQDQYGRILAYAWQNGRLLNEALVAAGQAMTSSRLPNIRYEERLQRAQETARLSGLGLWDPSNPMRQTPTEFRETL